MKRSREVERESSTAPHLDDQSGLGTLDTDSDDRVAKYTELESSDRPTGDYGMNCSLQPHRGALTFKSYDEYAAHYLTAHTNRCLECGANLPSEHLLNIHHEECHDSFVAVKRERGEHTYSCFVEGCDRKCMTPQKRRMHLIDKHMYPKNFFFAVTKEGIDGRRSLLVEGGHHRRKSSSTIGAKGSSRKANILESTLRGGESQTADDTMTAEDEEASSIQPAATERPDVEMDELAGAMSALQFVPNSVRFGRGGGRAGFAKR